MPIILGVLVFTLMLKVGIEAVSNAVTESRASKAGQWDVIDRQRDRREARRLRRAKQWAKLRKDMHRRAGGDGDYRPGAGAVLSDWYHAGCERMLERQQAKRAARGPYTVGPDHKPWHERVDEAVYAFGRRARQAWQGRGNRLAAPHDEQRNGGGLADEGTALQDSLTDRPGYTGGPAPDPTPVPPPLPPLVVPRMVPVEPPLPIPACPAPTPPPDHHAAQEDTMASLAEEIHTNEAARRSFAEMRAAAQRAMDALGAVEAARKEIQAHSQAANDAMSAKAFDRGATAAAAEVQEQVGIGTLATWTELFDNVSTSAENGEAALQKWLDTEGQIAAEGIDPSTLASTQS